MNETMDTPEVERSLMQKLGDAIKGTEADYTKIPLKTAILLLAVPMILELIMESTFALVDILFVGKLGASAVATVGLTENYLFLLYSIAMGVATAVTAVVAKKVGEKDTEGASISAAQAIYIAVLVSLPFSLAGILFPKELLSLMGATDWSLEHGYRYTQWMLGSNVVIVLLFVVNAIFRGAGDAAIAMRVLVISNLINIVLDPIFIFGWGPIPAMGVEGAAIATTIGRSCAVVIQLWAIFNIGKHIRIYRRHLRLNWSSVFHIIKASVGGVGQMLVAMTAWIFLMRILAETGEHAVAGAT
ncbi:MAG: MATE family efflux transporter, partial [Flavobacteriales bacterium]|nr:MATE family efflux transporter [Flavobacteriales bacterium]